MNVKVLAKRFGNYIEGDVITNMPESTALALIKNNLVEEDGEVTKVNTKKTTNKK